MIMPNNYIEPIPTGIDDGRVIINAGRYDSVTFVLLEIWFTLNQPGV